MFKMKYPSGRPYGKRTDELCPICELCNLVNARGFLKCPVCGFKRSNFYYTDVLSNFRGMKKNG